MNIALIFAGISFGHKSERDFNHCFPNINRNLIQPLREEHSVYNYVMTYDNDRMDEVTKLLNPKRLASIPFEGSKQNPTRSASLSLLSSDDIDFYIMSMSDKIICFSIYEHGSSFSKTCSEIYDIKYECVML